MSTSEQDNKKTGKKAYLKAMPLRVLADVEVIKHELTLGNILILKITPLARKSVEDVRVAVIGGLVFVSFSAVAYFLDFPRFFIWGALFTIAVIATEIFGTEIGSYLFLGFGSTAVLVGIVYFIAFLKKYPGEKGVPING